MTVVGEPTSVAQGRDTSTVPFRITDDQLIPAERYTSQEFHDWERERLWPREWQVACREEDLPRIGDFMEYTIMEYSILVVRSQSGDIKAFHNACRHRATQLGQGSGSFPTGQIVCPFHGWKYDLDGTSTYVYARQGFRPECLEHAEIDLKPVQVAIRWGAVWVNLDQNARSLEESLGRIVEYIDPLGMDLMRVQWWKQIRLEANWKVAQEAFFESYHVMQTHPELAMFADGDALDMDTFDGSIPLTPIPGLGHWAHVLASHNFGTAEGLQEGASSGDSMVAINRANWFGTRAQMTERAYEIQEELLASGVPCDDNLGTVLKNAVFEDALARNIPLPAPTDKSTSWAHVFPNMTFVSGYGSSLIYRSRPDGNNPNACIYDFWSVEIPPTGTESPKPVQATDEFFEQLFIVQQDKSNIERQQVGLRSRGYRENRLATTYERSISLFHRRLDQILAEPPAGLDG
jgi:phenylpropionate dioxygenase-like ring-hydroxylating dioxygenase large terminal subunit